MLDKNIGYIICETATTEPVTPHIIQEKNNRVTAEVIFQDANIRNRNSRYYDKKELQPAIEKDARIKELMNTGNFVGERNHPMSQELSRQQVIDISNASHKITKMWMDGDYVRGHVRGTPSVVGEEFNNYILDDTKVSFSLRALGTVKNTAKGAEVQNIKVITYDWVIYPSHKTAYMQGLVTESAVDGYDKTKSGIFVPVSNNNVANYVKNESANLKSVLESFELLYESMEIIGNGSGVRVKDSEGSTFVINLESYIQNEIMNYCYK